MAAGTFQKIMSAALDMKGMLINMGVPEPRLQEKPPPIKFEIPPPKPLREALLTLNIPKEAVDRLNQIYISRVNEYRSEVTRELQLLWRDLHVEGSHTPLRAWEAVLLAQRKTQETIYDSFISQARDHFAKLDTKKRRSQPVFDQVSIRAYLFSVSD